MRPTWARRLRGGLRHRLARTGGRLIGTLTRVRTGEPVAALTFDDGPDPAVTPRLLEILADAGARATFFMTGESAAKHPDIVSRVREEGHAVANHTWSHAALPPLSAARRREELGRCREALGKGATRFFRPPRGLQSLGSYLTVRAAGYDVVGWSVQVRDWLDRPAEEMSDELIRWIRPGSIVLLHDRLAGSAAPAAADRSELLEAVKGTLASLRDLRFVTLPELVESGEPVREPWFVRDDEDWNRPSHRAQG